ncbi:MAG: hypothetical protein K5654_07680 [Lachnospiraceae bacterium]|nr:hypothetical protein [Lachnospiraceae bacterium]
MNPNEITKKTDTIPFMDKTGKVLSEISLPEKVIPIISKRTAVSDNGTYYKGAGTIYTCHFANEAEDGAKVLSKTGILYEQYKVSYLNLCGKYGIFDFPHQPMFTDREGGCGPKEKNLLKMQDCFEYSAISEIVNVLDTGIPDHNIYVYRLKDERGSLTDTCGLIEYVLKNDFCTAWDKNLWADIYCYQFVRDVGDWYISNSIASKLGTIYALLHSLYETDLYQYLELQRLLVGEINIEKHFLIYYSAKVVQRFCPKEWEETKIGLDKVTSKLFRELLTLMVSAKACCHLENEEQWSWTKDKQLEKLNTYEKRMQKTLLRII